MHDRVRHLLDIETLITGYGKKQVLNGVCLKVQDSEVVALIGHNGAGKSTLLKAIFGLVPIWSGCIFLNQKLLNPPLPSQLLHSGVVYLPQGNRVFADLTVLENLEMAGTTLPGKKLLGDRVEYVLNLFPSLKGHLRQSARTLSGGEKQMLALASALILSPRLMLLDEPSLGLAPSLAVETLRRIKQISSDSNTAVLIIEQKVREVIKIAQRVYVLRNGQISFFGDTVELNDDSRLREVYL